MRPRWHRQLLLLFRWSRGNGQYTEREVTFLNQINVATFINNLLLCILCCAETEKRRVTSASAHTANGSLTFECLQPQKKKRKRKRFEVTNLRHAETLSIAELFFLYFSPSPTMLSFWSCTQNKKKRNSNRVVVISFLSLSHFLQFPRNKSTHWSYALFAFQPALYTSGILSDFIAVQGKRTRGTLTASY